MSSPRTLLKLAALASITAAGLGAYFFWFAPPEPKAEFLGPTEKEAFIVQGPQRPPPVLPEAVDKTIKFKDIFDEMADQFLPRRSFEIPLPGGEKRHLTAIRLDDPDWKMHEHNDQALITRIADHNAAFSSAVAFDMPVSGPWTHINIEIGDFAQDYCGDVSALYSFRNATIFAIAVIDPEEIGLAASQCPLNLDDYIANKSKYEKVDGGNDFGAFCIVRSNCLKAYYEQPENRERLLLPWLKTVAEVEVR